MTRFVFVSLVTAYSIAALQQSPAPATPATLTVPAGFSVSVFASGLNGARLMAVSPDGVLVVAQRANVVALPDANGDGQAEPKVLLTDQPYAHSVAFANGYLYIATTPAILRVRWANGTIAGAPETIAELPSSRPSIHTSRSLRVGPDGRLYVTLGSSCNFCVEPEPRRTTMLVFNADGTNGRPFATGLRNAVGFDWDPQTRRLWAGDNGIDKAGDDTPPDEINLVEEGKDYGHPFVIGRGIPSPLADDRSAADRERAKPVNPVFELPPHVAPMGVAFYTGTRFPEAFRTSLYVALHGSTDRTAKVGYKVVRLIMENGTPVRSEDFVTGWLVGDAVTGRPVGIVTGPDGALYVSDDNKGFIYRIAAQTATPPVAIAQRLDTPQARVYVATLQPHAPSIARNGHATNRVLIYMDDGVMTVKEGADTNTIRFKRGDVRWRPAGGPYTAENTSDHPIRILEIDLKGPPAGPAPVTKLDPVTVDPEHYKVDFENEFVRVLRVRFGAGEKGATHEHILNRVVFYVNDQPNAKADDVRMSGAATHAESNDSAGTAIRIAVELK